MLLFKSSFLLFTTDDKDPLDVAHLLVVGALAAVSTWGANNLFPIKLNYLTGIWSREREIEDTVVVVPTIGLLFSNIF